MQCFRSAFPYAFWLAVDVALVEGFVSGFQGFKKKNNILLIIKIVSWFSYLIRALSKYLRK